MERPKGRHIHREEDTFQIILPPPPPRPPEPRHIPAGDPPRSWGRILGGILWALVLIFVAGLVVATVQSASSPHADPHEWFVGLVCIGPFAAGVVYCFIEWLNGQ